GGTPSESDYSLRGEISREEIIRDFHRPDSRFKVIIANPFAVGESISLHKACHNAIYLEKNFNAGMHIQSKDRIHRVGLSPTDKIQYFHILTAATIDEVVHDRLSEKE